MFNVGDKIKFLCYKRKSFKGNPTLTVGQVYEVCRQAYNTKYVWVKNNAGYANCYSVDSFEKVAP